MLPPRITMLFASLVANFLRIQHRVFFSPPPRQGRAASITLGTTITKRSVGRFKLQAKSDNFISTSRAIPCQFVPRIGEPVGADWPTKVQCPDLPPIRPDSRVIDNRPSMRSPLLDLGGEPGVLNPALLFLHQKKPDKRSVTSFRHSRPGRDLAVVLRTWQASHRAVRPRAAQAAPPPHLAYVRNPRGVNRARANPPRLALPPGQRFVEGVPARQRQT